MIRTINPTGADLKRVATTVPGDTPITMLNLLRFRAQAEYPADAGFAPCSGREAYARYSKDAFAKVRQAGGEVVLTAPVLQRVIGPEGEDWDELLLVRYPSVRAFLGMISDPAYQAITVHRTAALADSRLTMLRTPHAM